MYNSFMRVNQSASSITLFLNIVKLFLKLFNFHALNLSLEFPVLKVDLTLLKVLSGLFKISNSLVKFLSLSLELISFLFSTFLFLLTDRKLTEDMLMLGLAVHKSLVQRLSSLLKLSLLELALRVLDLQVTDLLVHLVLAKFGLLELSGASREFVFQGSDGLVKSIGLLNLSSKLLNISFQFFVFSS